MKILHLVNQRKWTGAAEPVFLLCRELSRLGHTAHLAYSQPVRGKRLSSRPLRQGRLDLFVEPSRCLYRPKIQEKAQELQLNIREDIRLNTLANVRDNRNDYQVLKKIFVKKEYDIVHCHLSHSLYLALLARGQQKGKPYLFYTHHSARPPKTDYLHGNMFRNRVDRILTPSPQAAETFTEKMHLPQEKVILHRGGIELGPFENPPAGKQFRENLGLPEKCLLVGTVARMQPKRDHETLIRALARLNQPAEEVQCLLIGDGEHRIPIENLILQLNLEDQVHAPGYLQEDFLQAFAALDIFIYPAPGSDASCRAVMEAMALGKPVVGCRAAAVPLLINDGQTGYLFEQGNAEQLAEKLEALINSPHTRKTFGAAARQKAFAEFSIQSLSRTMEKLYTDVLTRL